MRIKAEVREAMLSICKEKYGDYPVSTQRRLAYKLADELLSKIADKKKHK